MKKHGAYFVLEKHILCLASIYIAINQKCYLDNDVS